MRSKQALWVVEILLEYDNGERLWASTLGTAFSREEGHAKVRSWQHNNPDDSFRLRKYAASE